MRRLVWLLPLPVRTAQTATTGLAAWSIVRSGPSSRKSAPAARARDAVCITSSWERSEYERTTSSTRSVADQLLELGLGADRDPVRVERPGEGAG